LLPFQCIFQAPLDDEEDDNQSALQCNFILFASLCVKLSIPCIANCFPWYESDMSTLFFWVSLKKTSIGARVIGGLEPPYCPLVSYGWQTDNPTSLNAFCQEQYVWRRCC
jgi:hypothetical protein